MKRLISWIAYNCELLFYSSDFITRNCVLQSQNCEILTQNSEKKRIGQSKKKFKSEFCAYMSQFFFSTFFRSIMSLNLALVLIIFSQVRVYHAILTLFLNIATSRNFKARQGIIILNIFFLFSGKNRLPYFQLLSWHNNSLMSLAGQVSWNQYVYSNLNNNTFNLIADRYLNVAPLCH